MKNPGPIEFDAVIKQSPGGGAWVDFPHDLKQTYGKANLVPVKITFDSQIGYSGSLAKMGGECAMVLIRKHIRQQLGKQAGDSLHVKVELDTSERKVKLDDDELHALKKAGLTEKFKALSYSHQREYHQWIVEAKRPETRTRRIQKMLDLLSNDQKEPR